jgi:YtfJ family uncharacterized protein
MQIKMRASINMKNILLSILLGFICSNTHAIETGKKLAEIELSGDDGGLVIGGKWSSLSLLGKVSVMFYVDPDEKDLNRNFSDALKEHSFDLEQFQSLAVINMEATWAPNFAIASKLEKSQKEFPTTIYVKDKDKVLVKKWGLADDNNVIVIFDRLGKVQFYKAGKLNKDEIERAIKVIYESLPGEEVSAND